MTLRRVLLTLAVTLTTFGGARAQSVDLTEAPLTDRCFRVELTMDLKGKITVQQQGENVSFPQEATARHVFVERVLHATGGVVDKTARHYDKAEIAITFNQQVSRRSLRAERADMVAHRNKDQMLVYSPKGGLTREEKELTEHFDTLFVSALVPSKIAAVGDSWRLGTPVAIALCDLDGLTEHDLTCKLEEVKGDLAAVSVIGTATGISRGAQVKLLVNARYLFDTREKRVAAVDWKQSESRQQGPISPAMSADVAIQLTRVGCSTPPDLNDLALVPAQAEPAPEIVNLQYRDAKGRFELQHARDWHVVSPESSPQLVLRLMDRGDFIAQATVTPWKKAAADEKITLERFYELMKATSGWDEDEVLEKTDLKEPRGHAVYRVTASGSLNEVKAVQSFYLVAGPTGERLIVTFSVVPSQLQKLEARDIELVRNIVFPK